MERKRKLDLGCAYDDAQPSGAVDAGTNGGAAQRDAGDTGVNPYTGRPYSNRYYEILAGRKGEPPGDLQLLAHAHATRAAAQISCMQYLAAGAKAAERGPRPRPLA